MNVLELKAPDGRVYAYACGVCHHAHNGGGEMLCAPVTQVGPWPQLLESALRVAEQCCACRRCKAPLEPVEDGLRWRHGACPKCKAIEDTEIAARLAAFAGAPQPEMVMCMQCFGDGDCRGCGGDGVVEATVTRKAGA